VKRGTPDMKNETGLLGGLYEITEWIMKFAVVNLLWIIFNLPIILMIINLFFMEQIEEILFLMIPIIILIPLVFFPATTAMFAMVRGWIVKDEGTDQFIKRFWRYYRENYKRSVLSGLILTGVWLVLAVDIYYFSDKNIMMLFLFIIMGIILFVFTVNYFSITVHYHMKLKPSFKNAFLLTIGSPLLFAAVALSSGAVLYVSFNIFKYLIPFLTGSLIAYLSFSAFYRSYLKTNDKIEE